MSSIDFDVVVVGLVQEGCKDWLLDEFGKELLLLRTRLLQNRFLDHVQVHLCRVLPDVQEFALDRHNLHDVSPKLVEISQYGPWVMRHLTF